MEQVRWSHCSSGNEIFAKVVGARTSRSQAEWAQARSTAAKTFLLFEHVQHLLLVNNDAGAQRHLPQAKTDFLMRVTVVYPMLASPKSQSTFIKVTIVLSHKGGSLIAMNTFMTVVQERASNKPQVRRPAETGVYGLAPVFAFDVFLTFVVQESADSHRKAHVRKRRAPRCLSSRGSEEERHG